MKTRDKQRIFRRFMRGESVHDLVQRVRSARLPYFTAREEIENILREGCISGWDTGTESQCPLHHFAKDGDGCCNGCAFETKHSGCATGEPCRSFSRKDKRNVIFVKKGGA